MILNHRNCKTFEQASCFPCHNIIFAQFLGQVSSLLVLKTGQVRKLYDVTNGRRIRALPDIYPGQNLVAATFDPFKKIAYQTQDLYTIQPVFTKEVEVKAFFELRFIIISGASHCYILSKW